MRRVLPTFIKKPSAQPGSTERLKIKNANFPLHAEDRGVKVKFPERNFQLHTPYKLFLKRGVVVSLIGMLVRFFFSFLLRLLDSLASSFFAITQKAITRIIKGIQGIQKPMETPANP